MKRLAAVLLTVMLLAGCAAKEGAPYVPTGNALADEFGEIPTEETGAQEEQELTLAYYPDRELNPLRATDYTNRTLFSLIYQSLFVVDRDYNVWPMLCNKYAVSENLLTYVFYLADATFSDGTPVRPEDVVASLNAAMDKEQSGLYTSRFWYVRSIEVTEDGGVRVSLYTPMEDLPILLNIPILKESQIGEDRPLGSGPYMYDRTAGGLRLRRRTNWWCESENLKVTASAINLVAAESPGHIRDQFEFADVSLVCADPGSDYYADYRCDYELWDSEAGIFVYLACYTESKVFGSPSIRAALTYAIDREYLVDEYYRGFAWSASLPASPLSPYYNNGLAANYAYDPERFAQMIQNAGLVGREITFLVSNEDSLRLRVAESICAMLEAGGLVVKLETCPGYQLQYMLNMKQYDIYMAQAKLSPNMDLSPFFYTWGTLSYGTMDHEDTYELCKKALENQGNYYNLHKKVMDEGRLIPILFRSYAVYATRGVLTGLEPSRDNIFFYHLDLTLRDIQVPMD